MLFIPPHIIHGNLYFSDNLSKWNLIFIISGRGELAKDKLDYLEGDINDLIETSNFKDLEKSNLNHFNDVLKCVNNYALEPWRARYKEQYQDIFFISNFENIVKYLLMVESKYDDEMGVYIQPINQGSSYHCEFDLFYDPIEKDKIKEIKRLFLEISSDLMDSGAFFNRPYGYWAKEMYARHDKQTSLALKKVKGIFTLTSNIQEALM